MVGSQGDKLLVGLHVTEYWMLIGRGRGVGYNRETSSYALLITLIFLANILCVHVRKSDEMYASPTWCTHAKKENATEVTVDLRLWHLIWHFTSLSRIYLSRIVEKVPKNLSSYAPDQDEGNKQQCN